MKYIILLITILLIFIAESCSLHQKKSQVVCDSRVDSLFKYNIILLKRNFHEKAVYENQTVKFLYMLTYLSGIDFNIKGYSGEIVALKKTEVNKIAVWYERNKSKIDWQKHVLLCYSLIDKLLSANDLNELEEISNQLNNLRIQ